MPKVLCRCSLLQTAALRPARPVSTTLILIARLINDSGAGRRNKRAIRQTQKSVKAAKSPPTKARKRRKKGRAKNNSLPHKENKRLTGRGVVPGVDHHRRRPPRRERREHRVARQKERRRPAALKHPLDDLLAVAVGLRRRLGEQERVLARVEAEAVRDGVVPEGLDGVPVGVGAVGPEGRDDLK